MKTIELIKVGWTRTFGTNGYPVGRRAMWVSVLGLVAIAVAGGLSIGFEAGEATPLWATLVAGICLGLGAVLVFTGLFMVTEGRGKWLSGGGPCVGCGQLVTSADVGTLAEAKRIRDLMREHRTKLKAAREAKPHLHPHRLHR